MSGSSESLKTLILKFRRRHQYLLSYVCVFINFTSGIFGMFDYIIMFCIGPFVVLVLRILLKHGAEFHVGLMGLTP